MFELPIGPLLLADTRKGMGVGLWSNWGSFQLVLPRQIVYFIRHGQSIANIAEFPERDLPKFRDAQLTDVGHQQARALQAGTSLL